MFGEDVWRLMVNAERDSNLTVLVQKEGNHGNNWNYGQITLNHTTDLTVSSTSGSGIHVMMSLTLRVTSSCHFLLQFLLHDLYTVSERSDPNITHTFKSSTLFIVYFTTVIYFNLTFIFQFKR